MPAPIEVPHLVVGAGPVGLVAARLLSDAGRRCLVVERRDGPQRAPAAHVVNARTLEILRQAGIDMDAVARLAQSPADAGHVNFVTRLNGRLIGRLPFERQGDDSLADTPTPLRNISQHRLEPLLAAEATRATGVELRYGWEWIGAVQDDDGVTSTIRDVATGEESIVRSSWLLAADGAGSAVRKSLGIDMLGPPVLQSYVAIHARADLRHVVAARPGVLHFVLDPAASATLIAHDVDHEWVLMVRFDPERESIDDYDAGRCAALFHAAVGEEVPVQITGAGTWHMSAQVAERMRAGRVFLVGDAAHRFPPTGGMGLNTGVADAHGLVWKLCAVDDGWAAPSILDTYEVERRPVAEVNCQQSTTNAFKITTLFEALGLHPGATSADLLATLDDPSRREAIDAAVQEQAPHFDMLGLQLGYVYAAGALARATDPPTPADDPLELLATGEVGGRLPHGWLVDGRSTLDLVDTGGMTLLTFGAGWSEVADSVSVPLHHVPLDHETSLDGWRRQIGLDGDGALLVRPDQHIAWRTEARRPDGAGVLADALRAVLGVTAGFS